MSPLMESLSGFGAWNWLILAVLLFLLEVLVPGVHFLWFGLAAVIVGMLAFGIEIAWQWQVVIFALLSVIAVFGVRQFADPNAKETDEPTLNIRGQHYIGREVTVEKAISGGRGKVRVGDTLWSAKGPDAEAGTQVKITAIDGTVFIVETVKN